MPIQGLLQQFVECIDAMRSAELVVDPKQYFLQQAFERTAAQAKPAEAISTTTGGAASDNAVPAAVVTPQEFDIRNND